MASIYQRRKKHCVIYWYDVPGQFNDRGRPVRKQKWETYDTYDEALSRKKEVEYRQDQKNFTPPTNMTITDLLNRYFDVYGTLKWSYKTYAGYESQKNNYIDPHLGKIRVKDLTTLQLDEFYQKLLSLNAVGRKNQKTLRNVSTNTVLGVHKLLHAAFNKAVVWDLVSKNPCTRATLPTHIVPHKVILSTDDILRAIDLCDNPILTICIHLGFACTMRLGEILGLTWDMVDVSDEAFANDNSSLYINKILQRVELVHLTKLEQYGLNQVLYRFPTETRSSKSVLILKKPKTPKSERRIWIPRTPATFLRSHQAGQQKHLKSEGYTDHNLVIAGPAGQPIEHRTVYRALDGLLEKHNIPRAVFHSLRHSSATVKLKITGNDIKAVEGDIGHSSSNLLLNTYSHIVDKDRASTAKKFQTIIYEDGSDSTISYDEIERILRSIMATL